MADLFSRIWMPEWICTDRRVSFHYFAMFLSLFCLVLNSFYFQMCRKQLLWSGFFSKIFIRWWAPTLLGSCEDSQIWYVSLDRHYIIFLKMWSTIIFLFMTLLENFMCGCTWWFRDKINCLFQIFMFDLKPTSCSSNV